MHWGGIGGRVSTESGYGTPSKQRKQKPVHGGCGKLGEEKRRREFGSDFLTRLLQAGKMTFESRGRKSARRGAIRELYGLGAFGTFPSRTEKTIDHS